MLWHVQLESVRALARVARIDDSSVVVVNMLSFVGSLVTQIPTGTSLVVETIFIEPPGPSVFSKISPAHWQSLGQTGSFHSSILVFLDYKDGPQAHLGDPACTEPNR